MDVLDHLIDFEDQLSAARRPHHRAVVSGPGEHARTAAARVAREAERREKRVDEVELVHCTPRSGASSGAPGGSVGTTSVKMLPFPGSLRTETPPPCAST